MKLAFSKPTANDEERRTLFENFRNIGYEGLQLKGPQFAEYIGAPEQFNESWGTIPGVSSALITGGILDENGCAALRKLLVFAKGVNAEIVIYCHAVPREGLTELQIREFAKQFSEMGHAAREAGTRLSLHNHYNSPVMYREDTDVFYGAVEDGTVGLTVDTAHYYASGVKDIAGLILDWRSVIDNYHLKDFADGGFQVLGQGEIPFDPIFAAIKETGYDGWVSTDEESGSGLMEAMKTCYGFMKTGFAKA